MAHDLQPQAAHAEAHQALQGAPVSKKLDRIREKPKAGWTISDIQTACDQVGISCSPPTRGDHYKVSSPHMAAIVTIPAKRPIKTVYIREFLKLATAHIAGCQNTEKTNGKT